MPHEAANEFVDELWGESRYMNSAILDIMMLG
jgi:hypothetical protein